MLVDDVTVRLTAGRGGRGAVAFNKVKMMQGPTGADGGRGGSIYFEGVVDINALAPLSSRKEIAAEHGQNGRGQFIDGHDGKDLTIKVPVGTLVINEETGYMREITRVGERLLAAGGGTGGRGNFKFRSSTNTSPQDFEEGTDGDVAIYRLELRLIADVGLVGLPNAGKSSLLNALTAAKSRVANYPFTTLEAHLGSYYGLILADIPGLIEGASEGKGLGIKFLKHVARTKTIFHLVAANSDDVVRDHKIVRAELARYDAELAKKDEHVLLSKCDEVSEGEVRERIIQLKKSGVSATPISIIDDASLEPVKKMLNELNAKRGA